MEKYGGKLSPGIHYFEKGNKIVFPQVNSPFSSKSHAKNALITIMNNAGLSEPDDYKFDEDVVNDTRKKSKKEEVGPITATLNNLKQLTNLRKLYQKEIGNVKSVEYKTEKVDGKHKLIVTGLTKSLRDKLVDVRYLFTKNLKEENEFSKMMQIRAGIIK